MSTATRHFCVATFRWWDEAIVDKRKRCRPNNDVANAFVTWLRHASHHLKVVL